MNSLIILPDEVVSPSEAVISGARALRAHDLHKLKVGLVIRVALWNGGFGEAEVLEASPQRLVLKTQFKEVPPEVSALELIVAVPRPQTVKKVIATAAMMGAKALHFIRAERCEKSYLDSNSLSPEAINEEIINGLEQACSSNPPEVFVHRRFKTFVEDYISEREKIYTEREIVRIVADTSAASEQSMAALKISEDAAVFLAIGPESGWNDFELTIFKHKKFINVSLGSRILRVETALTALIAQVELLRRM